MRLTGLFIFPVKSLGGIALSASSVDQRGLLHDRRFMVVDESGRFLTQRTLPRMALVHTAVSSTHLTLSAGGQGRVSVLLEANDAPLRTVSVWKSGDLQAEDCGDEVAAWLGDFLEVSCRLVRIGPAFKRFVAKGEFKGSAEEVSFADAFPFLILSEESLADLNRRIVEDNGSPVPLDRFRTNLLVSGCDPYAEDTWSRFKIGEVVFKSGGPCARCTVTTTDQLTAERGKEPLRTLSRFRRDASEPSLVNFAQNLVHETKRGTLRVGDAVTVL